MAKRNLTGAKPVTQAILGHLQAGHTITHQAAQSLYGKIHLAAYICTLRRKKGYNIKTHKIEVTSAIGKKTEHKKQNRSLYACSWHMGRGVSTMSTLAETALSIGINPEKLPACPTLGKWYYLPALGKPKTNTACRARALAHGVVYLCNHVTGDTVTWFSDDLPQDPEALAKLKKQAEYAQYQAKRDQEKRYEKASIDAKNIITNYCTQANPNHHYLLAKGLKPTKHLYQQLNELVIPVYDSLSFFDPRIQSLQFIGEKGGKRFLRGGKMAYGSYWDNNNFHRPKIEAMNARNVQTYNGHDDIIISEGWATSQSLAQQWGVKGWHISAFNAGNIKKVALAIGKKYPRAAIIIAADNDQAGIKAAKEACFLVNGVLHMPEFTDHERETYKSATDWNDRYLIDKGLMPLQKKGTE